MFSSNVICFQTEYFWSNISFYTLPTYVHLHNSLYCFIMYDQHAQSHNYINESCSIHIMPWSRDKSNSDTFTSKINEINSFKPWITLCN